jgi:HlyD family secretion protein
MVDSPSSRFARLRLAILPADPAGEGGGVQPQLSLMDKAVTTPFLTRPRAVGAAATAGLLVVAALLYARYGLTSSLAVDSGRLTMAPTRQAIFQEYIPVTGNIVPARTVYLDAVEGGQVTQVHAEEGRMVEAGQPLLELKNTDLQLRLVEAEARLTEQVNNLNLRRLQVEQTHLQLQERLIGIDEQILTLKRDLVRNERLLVDGTVAAKSVEDMRASLEALQGVRDTVQEAQRVNRNLQTHQTAQMQSSVDTIAANLDVARENLENLVMRAPIAGQLTVFEAEVGEAKARGQRIGQIDGIGAFKVSALVDEFYLGRIAVGQPASVNIGGRDHALEVTKVYPNVRERQFQVDMAFAGEQPAGLRRGQTLRMNVEIGAQAESLVVANGPWLDDTAGTWAFVMAPDGREARRRNIRIGRRNPEMVEVTGGLEEGERLIVSSYARLGDFERIDIRGAAR